MSKKHKIIKSRWVRTIIRVIALLLLLFLVLILFIRSPWGQSIIVSKAVTYLEDKIGTEVQIEKLYLTFSGDVSIDGFYIEDQHKDTLVYSKELQISLALLPLIRGEKVDLKQVDWSGLKASIDRDSLGKFNFDFIIDAFASQDTTQIDTTTSSTEFLLGDIDLNDFKLRYHDDFSGIHTDVILGNLAVDMNVFDVENMKFDVAELDFSDTKINYTQTKITPTDTTSGESSLPFLKVGNMRWKNIEVSYRIPPENVTMDAKIGMLSLSLPEADMEQQKINLEEFLLKDSEIAYRNLSEQKTQPTDTLNTRKPIDFQWPEWSINAEKITLKNNGITFQNGPKRQLRDFDPSDLQLTNLNFSAKDVYYLPENVKLSVDGFSFNEKDRFSLNQLAFDLGIDAKSVAISDLELSAQNTYVSGDLQLNYPSINHFLNAPETGNFKLALPFQLNLKDAYYFQPALKENKYLDSLSARTLKGRLAVNGTLDSLHIDEFYTSWSNTDIALQGIAKTVMDTDSLRVKIPQMKIQTNKKDITRFIDEEAMGVDLPDSLQLAGSLSGGFTDGAVNLILNSTDGDMELNGEFFNQKSILYAVDVGIRNLNLGKMLQNEKIAPVSFSLQSSGSGSSLHTLNATLESKFDSLNYAGYDLSPLMLNGQMTNGEGTVHLNFKDENLDMGMNVGMDLDTLRSKINLQMDVRGADLYKLGVTKNDIRTGFKLNAEYIGNSTDFKVNASLTDGVAVYQNDSYNLGDFDINAAVSPNQTSAKIFSKMLQGELTANTDPSILAKAMKNYLVGHWNDSLVVDSVGVDRNAKMHLQMFVKQTPALSEIYVPGLETMDSVTIKIDFDEQQQFLNANVTAPYIKYNESEADSLQFTLHANGKDMDFALGWEEISASPFLLGETYLKGDFTDKTLQLQFNSKDEEAEVANINSTLYFKNDTLQFHISPDDLILNRKPWQIPESNEIVYAPNFMEVQNFVLRRNDQEIKLDKIANETEKINMEASFQNFKLATILSMLNPEEPIAKGTLRGNFTLEDVFNETGIQADLNIEGLEILEVPLGRLALNASSRQNNQYQLALSLKEGYVDMDLSGDYLAMEQGAKLNFSFDLNALQVEALEIFSEGAISNTSGAITGKAKLSGTTENPVYEGNLDFQDVRLFVNELNTQFALQNESMTFDNNGLNLNKISMTDADNNAFTLDGTIGTGSFSNPTFDLTMVADNFKILNATREDNDLFYGQVSLDTDITIKGDLEVPKVEGKLKINEGSTFTVVVPESQLDINEREGVVVFVNKTNENDILTKRNVQTQKAKILENFDVNASLSVDKNSTFRIVINERTGDNLEISGVGEFNFKMEPNGRTSLSGQYEVANGHYEASLYNIVKRRFDISEGSKITWNGDPMDAQLNIKAIYKVETSASALMATQTTSVTDEVVKSYRQKLPFLVYLFVDGELLEPELSFQLDMPEDSQGAVGGNVYGYVQQLNGQEEELNKQVFSLLVMNRFFPGAGSDGSAGGPASIARDNVNDVLSGQLNAFSDKLMGNTGVQLDFGLDSYTDYQSASPTDRTELDINASKSLFDDRLVIQVGSEVDIQGNNINPNRNAPVIGNVGLEYLITEDGRYRLRGYRKNQFESVVDGELIVTGISIIFNKEFNKFKELWERKIKEEIEKEKEAQQENQETE